MKTCILVYSELDTQYAILKHQEAVLFNNRKAAEDFMRQMYDSINEELNYLTVGSFSSNGAEMLSARTNEIFYWKIIPTM